MKALAQILGLYEKLNRQFADERDAALSAGDQIGADRIAQQRIINDQAYFILCWGQLETEIDNACRAAIRRRRQNASWEMRRGFDFYDPEDRRLSGLTFDRRASLVLDRSGGRGSAWAKLITYYETRNQIAHGRLQEDRLDVGEAVNDFYTIQGEITR